MFLSDKIATAVFWLVVGTIVAGIGLVVVTHRSPDFNPWLIAALLCAVICLPMGLSECMRILRRPTRPAPRPGSHGFWNQPSGTMNSPVEQEERSRDTLDAQGPTLLTKLVWTLYVVVILNLLAFGIAGELLGGTAWYGHAEGGRFFLGSHGKLTETTEAIFHYSQIHEFSVMVTWPIPLLGVLSSWIMRRMNGRLR